MSQAARPGRDHPRTTVDLQLAPCRVASRCRPPAIPRYWFAQEAPAAAADLSCNTGSRCLALATSNSIHAHTSSAVAMPMLNTHVLRLGQGGVHERGVKNDREEKKRGSAWSRLLSIDVLEAPWISMDFASLVRIQWAKSAWGEQILCPSQPEY